MKLRLDIYNCFQGNENVFNCGEGPNLAFDVRTACKALKNFDHNKTVLLAKFFGEEGFLLVLIQANTGGGRSNDNTSASIYVPAEADVSERFLIEIIEKVKSEICGKELKPNWKQTLRELFSQDIKTRKNVVPVISGIISSENGKYACRYYGDGYPSQEQVIRYLAQDEYMKYNGVFFIDKASGIELEDKKYEIKGEPKPYITILVPKEYLGFKPYINKKEVNGGIEIAVGSQREIIWTKKGYAPIPINYKAKQEDSHNTPQSVLFMDKDILVKFQKSLLTVCDKRNIPIKEYDARIKYGISTVSFNENNKKFIRIPQKYFLTKDVHIVVKVKGYAEATQDITEELILTRKEIRIELDTPELHYEIPIRRRTKAGGEDLTIRFRLHTDTPMRSNESPLPGYSVLPTDDEGKPIFLGVSYFYRLKWILLGVIAAGVIFACFFVPNLSDRDKKIEAKNEKIEKLEQNIKALTDTLSQVKKHSKEGNPKKDIGTEVKDKEKKKDHPSDGNLNSTPHTHTEDSPTNNNNEEHTEQNGPKSNGRGGEE